MRSRKMSRKITKTQGKKIMNEIKNYKVFKPIDFFMMGVSAQYFKDNDVSKI